MADLARRQGESEFEHHRRLVYGKLIDGTLSDEDYSEIAPFIYGKDYSSDVARRMMYGSCKTLQMMDDVAVQNVTNRDVRTDIDCKRIELEKERKKLQAEKIEYSRMLREDARDELIVEKIVEAISNIEPLHFPAADYTYRLGDRREGLLAFGDEHYGSEFTLYGLHGEIINQYSPEIAECRMFSLLDQVISIVKRENLKVLHVLNMGDFTDGVLRVGQLMKLSLGVVDSTVRYMELLSNWLNELSHHVHVKFQMVHGNHSELRMLGQQKGAFKDENMGKVVAAYVKMRLSGNPNFEFLENPTGLIFDTVAGFNVLGIHGEVRNMERAIRDFSATYGVDIDYMLAGHLHHSEGGATGCHKAVIRVPSIVGTDDYALSLNKVSDPGATFIVMDDVDGKKIEYTIYLD